LGQAPSPCTRSAPPDAAQGILSDLKRKPGKRGPTKAKPEDKRIAYDVALTLLIPEREAEPAGGNDQRL
jgi:hypothetical protein